MFETAKQLGRQRGMVLIAVLWIVAALAIVVTGLSQAVRADVRATSLARQGVVAQGLGDAAINLTLQQMLALPAPPAQLVVINIDYRGTTIPVEVMPLNGLIDINNASPGLLAALYSTAGGMQGDAALALAAATLEVRSRKDHRGQNIGFETIEDLLRVPGIDYGLYARLSALITADVQGSGRVNPLAAPPQVLAVLADGDVSRARSIAAQRDAGGIGVDTTSLNAGFIDSAAVRWFRLQARVPLADGGSRFVSRSVILGGTERDGLPWRTIRTGRQVASAGSFQRN